MELTIDIVKACKMTALSCRKCVAMIPVNDPLQLVYQRSFNQCEDVCFAFLQAASSNSQYLQKFIFLCIGLCEECADLAEEKKEDVFLHAARQCRNFSNMLIDLIHVENNRIAI